MKTRYFAMLITVTAVILFTSCSKSGSSTPTAGNPNTVNIQGMSFPATTTIKMGTTVTWNNRDVIAHTVTSNDDTTFNSGTLAAGASFSYQANKAGSFPYHCNFHSNMKGTLVVTQ